MPLPTKVLVSYSLLLIAFTPLAAGARLATRQTRIEVRAGDTAPMLVSLGEGPDRWINRAPEKLIGKVWKSGVSQAVRWKLRTARTDARTISYVYESAFPKLRAVWEWRAPAEAGPIEHTIHIQNLDAAELWIPLQDSLQFDWQVPADASLEQFFVEKGENRPSDAGTHRVAFGDGMQWTGASSTYAHPRAGEAREIIPFVAMSRTAGTHEGWYVGIEFSGRTRITLVRDGLSLHGAAGLNPDPGPFRTRLLPGDSFDTPVVFLGAFHGDMDAMSNVLRPWVRQVLTNPRAWANPAYPLLVNNTWGAGMQVDQALVERMLNDSSELGLEMLHVDAGWFRGVGDWVPDPKKFPRGLAPLADEARQRGLRFGIWADWTQAALSSAPGALNIHDPKVRDWLVSDLPARWKPEEFKGQTIDLGVPEAHQYAQKEVERMVAEYHLDMLEHDGYLVAQGCVREDHPHAPPDPQQTKIIKDGGSYIVESSNSTDVSYHATRAYYRIHEELRKRHPDLLLEICNDGGRMVDFGSAAHGDYFSITDAYDPLSNRRAFFDASYVLPAAMLEAYVEKWPTPRIENFRYMLRSGMLGWLTIMQDTNAWTPEQHAAAKDEIRTYKSKLRALIRDADLYHIAPRPDGVHWDGVEYFDAHRQRGAVYAFRGSAENDGEHAFRLSGLDSKKLYRLRFHDHSAQDQTVSGAELLESGLTVRLPFTNSSELVFFAEVTRSSP